MARSSQWRKWWSGWMLLFVCLFQSAVPQAAPVDAQRQVLLVLIDRLGYEDLAEMPHLQQIAATGSIGVMNVNTGGGRTAANAYATLAVGVPTRLQASALLAYDAEEMTQDITAGQLYAQLHGGQQQQGVLVLSMPRLLREQSQRQFAGRFGAIGDALHQAGRKTAVLGSCDTGTHLWRPATLLASDAQGYIDAGDVSHRLLATALERPYGVRTDYAALWHAFQQVQRRAAFVVFDLGDLYRLDQCRARLTPERYQALRSTVLQEIDAFAARLLPELQANRLLLVTAPQVAKAAAERGEWLAPLLLAGGDVPPHGLLSSATTRRAGIVSNLDLAPTVLQFLQVPQPAQMIGYPLQGTLTAPAQPLNELLATTVWTFLHRETVLTIVGVWIGLCLLATLLRLVYCVPLPERPLRIALWLGVAAPLCLYLLPLFHVQGVWQVAGAIGIVFLLFVAIPFRIIPLCRTFTGRLFWLAGATLSVVLIDTGHGGDLSASSLMSYDPIIGTRYYGVGNEYMGVLVGCALLAYGALWQSGRVSQHFLSWLGVLGSVGLTAFFASPNGGTNTGGALTMAGTAVLCEALQRHRSRRIFCLQLLATFAGTILLLLWLNRAPSTPSHIGAAAERILAGGGPELLRIFTRKSDMFWHILTSSIWPSVLLLVLGGFAWFLYTPLSRQSEWRRDYAALWTVISALVGGALIGLLTNDSGISVAALMLLFAVFPALLIWLEVEQKQSMLVAGVREVDPEGERPQM